MALDRSAKSHSNRPNMRRTLPLSCIGLLLFGLAACGSAATNSSATTSHPTSPQTEVTGALTPVTLQLSWLVNSSQIGEVVAGEKGFYEAEGIDLAISPGGPQNTGISSVASGQAQIGEISSSPLLMMAVSEEIPLRAFAVVAHQHPFAFFSLPDTPLKTPQDFKGLKIGTQATNFPYIRAMLKLNGMSENDLGGLVSIGSEVTPLLTGDIDIWTGWTTTVGQLDQLPDGYHSLSLWDTGVKLYSNIYYTTDATLRDKPNLVEAYIRATAKGWQYVREHTEEAVDILVEQYPSLDRDTALRSTQTLLPYVFDEQSDINGWGSMDPDVWISQIEMWDQQGQFKGAPPSISEMIDQNPLKATKSARNVN